VAAGGVEGVQSKHCVQRKKASPADERKCPAKPLLQVPKKGREVAWHDDLVRMIREFKKCAIHIKE
jgi:hypothetical protein